MHNIDILIIHSIYQIYNRQNKLICLIVPMPNNDVSPAWLEKGYVGMS